MHVPVGTAFLWWTYIGFKSTLDTQEDLKVPLLEVDINSEQCFLIFAVIATGLTVSDVCVCVWCECVCVCVLMCFVCMCVCVCMLLCFVSVCDVCVCMLVCFVHMIVCMCVCTHACILGGVPSDVRGLCCAIAGTKHQ